MPHLSHLRAFFFALQFLSRFPTPALSAPTAQDLARAALYYPLIGLLIGGMLLILPLLFPEANHLVLAALLTSLWIAVTGALHIDGLADSADAWLGSAGKPSRIHDILKDPLVGSAGAVAIVCIVLLKYSALQALLVQQQYLPILLSPVIGRAIILLLFTSTDYVRSNGLASDVVRHLNGRAALIIVALLFLLAVWISPFALLCVLLAFYFLRRLMIRLIGGCTGDTAGATVEICEAAWLCGAALL